MLLTLVALVSQEIQVHLSIQNLLLDTFPTCTLSSASDMFTLQASSESDSTIIFPVYRLAINDSNKSNSLSMNSYQHSTLNSYSSLQLIVHSYNIYLAFFLKGEHKNNNMASHGVCFNHKVSSI